MRVGCSRQIGKYVLVGHHVEPIEWRGKIRNCDGRRVEWRHRFSEDVRQNDVLIWAEDSPFRVESAIG